MGYLSNTYSHTTKCLDCRFFGVWHFFWKLYGLIIYFQVILDMVYSGTLKLKVENMHQVLSAGDIFLMNEVKCACAEFMLMVLNSDIAATEALTIRRSAELYSLTDLEHEADRVITLMFAKVAVSAAFCDLPYHELLSLFQSDYIQEGNEFIFWQAAVAWIKHNQEERSHVIDELMTCVRFPLILPEILLSTIAEDPLMSKSDRCKELIEEAMKYQLLPSSQSILQTCRSKPRCTTRNTVIYCLSVANFKCYIPEYNRWYSLASPPGKRDITTVHRHSTTTPNNHCSQCYLVTVAGLVYACTQATRLEEVGNFQLIRMQQYSLNENIWKECSLPVKVSIPTFLIECNAELYACSRNAVERYVPDKNTWEVVSISRLSPCQFAVSDENRILLFSLEEGICQEMCMDRPNLIATRQVMSPNRFISEVISATKLPNHDVFLSLRTLSGISRKIFNVKSNLWRDAGIFHGTSCIQPRPGQHFPHWMNPSEPWITLGDRNSNTLYILATKSGMCDIPSPVPR